MTATRISDGRTIADVLALTATEPAEAVTGHVSCRDPDCPQPIWLREVLSVAGYSVIEEAGTWIARSGDVECFVWVKEEGDVYEDHLALLDDPDAFPVRETIQEVTVYGNENGWGWRTDGLHVFIRQGPDGDSKLPSLEELTPIVVASLDVPYPLGRA